MNWLDKMERKWGRHAIPGICRYMILANILGYVVQYLYQYANIDIYHMLNFSAADIFRGQIWRLVTWIFMPSSSFSVWTMLFILCLLMLGDNLERGLGSFRMTVYFAGAIILSDIGGLLIYLIFKISVYQTLYYALFSLYLMLGLFMPDAEVRLYFVLPIKMKYMIIVYAVMFIIELWNNFSYGIAWGFALSSEMIFAVINLLIFVNACKHHTSYRQNAAQKRRQQDFRRQAGSAGPTIIRNGSNMAHHKCCICGRTDETNPELTFRYCSKCTGAKEYCNDHLFTHVHS